MREGERSAIEHNLRVLSVVALALFGTLIAALTLVQHSLVASQQTLETVIVPVQQDLGQLESAVAGVFERQAHISATASSRELDALKDRAALQSALTGAQAQIEALLASATVDSARVARERAKSMAPEITGFLAADDELFASVARYHELREDFQHRLTDTQSALRTLTEQASGVAGVVRLNYVVQLRRAARDPGIAQIREIVFGNDREQLELVDDLANAALDLSALAGRIGLAETGDTLNSIAANEIAQNRNRILNRLEALADVTGSDAELARRVDTLHDRFLDVTAAVGDDHRTESLLALRKAIVLEQQHAAHVRELSASRARDMTASVAVLQAAVNELTAESSRSTRRTAIATRVGTLLLVAIGIAAMVLGARRVGASVKDLRAQNRRLEQLRDELTALNASLEDQVAERTKALTQRERSLQLVLDSTGDGLMTVTLDGTVLAERSRAATEWLGAPSSERQTVWALFCPDDAKQGLHLQMSFEQLVEDVMPFELSADQMPKRFVRQGRVLEVEWRAVTEEGRMTRVLVIARDVTERLEAERVERETRELQDLVTSVLRDRPGFVEGVGDARLLLGQLAAVGSKEVEARVLHTLKGNMALLGFTQLAAACHDLENELAMTGERVTHAKVDALTYQLDETLERVQGVIGSEFLTQVAVREKDVDKLLAALEKRYDHAVLQSFVASWRDEAVDAILRRFATQAARIAASLGKQAEIVVDGGGVRIPQGELRGFWRNLVHAVRNAIDHGIESPEQREEAGKPAAGRLSLVASTDREALVLCVEDDGRGLDYEALRAAAHSKGLPAETRADLVEAIFADGVTTKTEVTSISGRGVGMAALRQACLELGGSVVVESEPSAGTRLTFRLPLNRPPSLEVLRTIPPKFRSASPMTEHPSVAPSRA